MKTQKILDINEGGRRLVCIKHAEGRNPYRLAFLTITHVLLSDVGRYVIL